MGLINTSILSRTNSRIGDGLQSNHSNSGPHRLELYWYIFQILLYGGYKSFGYLQQPGKESLLGFYMEKLCAFFGGNQLIPCSFYWFLSHISIPRVWEFKNACFQFLVFGIVNRKWPHFWSQFSDFTPKHLLPSSILLENYSTMPFTAAKIVLFFEDQGYMAITCRTATALAAEAGLAGHQDFCNGNNGTGTHISCIYGYG